MNNSFCCSMIDFLKCSLTLSNLMMVLFLIGPRIIKENLKDKEIEIDIQNNAKKINKENNIIENDFNVQNKHNFSTKKNFIN